MINFERRFLYIHFLNGDFKSITKDNKTSLYFCGRKIEDVCVGLSILTYYFLRKHAIGY